MAAEVQRAGAHVRKGIDKDPRNPERLEFDSANSRRRAAVIKGCARALAPGENIHQLFAELIDEGHEFRNAHHFNAYITNLDVLSKLASEIIGDRDLAHSYSEQALEYSAVADNWWVLQEHYWREALYFHWKQDKSRVSQNVIEAINLYEKYPVVLEPTLVDGEPRPHNPFEDDLVRLKMKRPLAARIVQIRGPLSAIPFDLSDERLDDIVKMIMG